MKKTLILAELAMVLLLPSCSNNNNDMMSAIIEKGLERSIEQSEFMAASLMDQPDRLPKTTEKDGTLVTSDTHWWCSGFFPGTLWMLYEATGNKTLKKYAENYTMRIEKEQYALDTHDLGFMMNCSFGNGYRITGNKNYKKVLLQSARSLATRYNENLGVIRSWDNKPKWMYPVIIDNLMNLELLENAYKLSQDSLFDKIANSHATVTMANHFRPDYSSCHVVDYDTIDNKTLKMDTHQGYSSTSAWARGQAWGLYGYTMMYRETQNGKYLQQAINIAKFILHHPNLPEDKIPYWDFDAPNIPDEPRDASAGSIIASALLELSQCVNDDKLSKEFQSVAGQQLRTLSSDEYLAAPRTNGGFILKHSVGNKPRNSEVDVPLTYADYYYVEALLRYKKLLQ
ncbi:glycosyl hydrolase family 88 [Bacteroides zoogleoformans]|uniref:Glucuronyl hydrolase n=1 Tax=Bacteroides zoogleoformans TaxID=28119 RepID=A0ABN5IL58_9BACE|nr:glycoside hydrolase family 88 protein [Bacteroides zoogleoformans]AVM53610.1 glucuronyl hydrolase [Bacteroides zoogleoformans]TWJ13619.1 glycosyl hydrolase family 88 [Bacteroides zoogleoformans]